MNIPPEKIEIRSKDGASSSIRVFRAHDPDAAVIICMPAMGVAAKHYSSLAEALTVLGWNVIIADLRGNGDSLIRAGRGTDFGYYEMVAYDWPAVIDKATALFQRSKKIFFGHSLGGQLSALYMTRWPGNVSALILIAAPSVYYRGWPFHYALSLLILTRLARLTARILGYFPARWVGFGNRITRTVATDWAHTVRTGQYEPQKDTFNYEALLPQITDPVLAISFSDDTFAPQKAVDNFCLKMLGANITRWHLTPEEIGKKAVGHMGFLKPSDQLLMMISDWLLQVLKGRQIDEG